jgi:pyruvate formate lyase activating enzyme
MTPNMNGARDITGILFDIQRFSLHDGPGLRTNVFLKGCGLRCWWCSNPEGRMALPEVAFFDKECFLCGDCIQVCPTAAVSITSEHVTWDSAKCDGCRLCIPVCSANAFRVIGKEINAGSVIDEVLRDAAFFHPHGGLTLTGGEPALQPEFSAAILKLAREAGLHTAIETCGAVPWKHLAQLLPYLDLILFDLKHIDPQIHSRMTGQNNLLILDNLRAINRLGGTMVIRIPLIPGFNTDESSLREMAEFIRSLETINEVHLLGYHTLGKSKYSALDRPYRMGDTPSMRLDQIHVYAKIFQQAGLKVITGG